MDDSLARGGVNRRLSAPEEHRPCPRLRSLAKRESSRVFREIRGSLGRSSGAPCRMESTAIQASHVASRALSYPLRRRAPRLIFRDRVRVERTRIEYATREPGLGSS
jgi:hypothetical protein